MRIRILQLKNNFYRDKKLSDEYDRKKELGEFCVLGYFDALDVDILDSTGEGTVPRWNLLGKVSVSQLDEPGNMRTLVCCTNEEDKDNQYWNDTQYPFYFVSMIRVNREKYKAEQIKMNMGYFQANSNFMVYFTYDHSDAIVVYRTKKYSEGVFNIEKIRQQFDAFKIHTVVSIREEFLVDVEHIKSKISDEKVDWRLHVVVKDFEKARKFFDGLSDKLWEKGYKSELRVYDTLGSSDYLVEFDGITVSDLLENYHMGGYVTHTDMSYEEAFYNIESEVLVRKEKTANMEEENE